MGGAAEAVGAGAWDLGGVGEAEDVGAGDEDEGVEAGVEVGVEAGAAGAHPGEEVWDGVVGVEDGVGVVVHVPGVEQEAGVCHEEGEGIGGGVEHGGVEGGLCGGALAVAGEAEVEARAGCLE